MDVPHMPCFDHGTRLYHSQMVGLWHFMALGYQNSPWFSQKITQTCVSFGSEWREGTARSLAPRLRHLDFERFWTWALVVGMINIDQSHLSLHFCEVSIILNHFFAVFLSWMTLHSTKPPRFSMHVVHCYLSSNVKISGRWTPNKNTIKLVVSSNKKLRVWPKVDGFTFYIRLYLGRWFPMTFWFKCLGYLAGPSWINFVKHLGCWIESLSYGNKHIFYITHIYYMYSKIRKCIHTCMHIYVYIYIGMIYSEYMYQCVCNCIHICFWKMRSCHSPNPHG